jgi:PAS domain S-box-containing protein/putative nucleotidyltransferase with HDIG domain
MIRKDGEEVWAELSSHPIKLLGRTLVLGIARDITEQRRSEESLKKSETKYRALFECANDAVFLMDLKENTKMVNQRAAAMLGYTIPELLGMSFNDIVTFTGYQDARSRITEIMGEAPLELHERIFRRKDGSEIPVEINLSLLRDDNGKPLYIQRIVRDISARKKYVSDLQQSAEKLRLALEGVIKAVAATVEQRDPYTAGHQKRVAELARAIAAEMSFSTDQIEAVYMAGVIHDIGKISVPAEILSRPGALSDAEFSLIKLHAKIGYDILKDIEFPWPITQIIYQHHERLDGSGYPQGLRGEAILVEARILAVADVVEAMASHRPYRPARGLESAFLEISKEDCYDRDVAAACLRLFTEKKYQL